MTITHKLETLTAKQKSDLELAQILLDNLNSIKPIPNFQNNSLTYDGERFKIERLGFFHKFLIDDLHLAIEMSYQKHKEFILDTFQKQVDNFINSNKTEKELVELGDNTFRLLKYYSFNYPLYLEESDFKKTLKNINISVSKLLK